MKKKVLITGISGFLGSNIAEKYISEGWTVIGLKRNKSNLWRCNQILEQIVMIDIENENWVNQTIEFCPDVIIHSAWEGVSANDRQSYSKQIDNLKLVFNLLEISVKANSKFIGLGSQAEYGTYSGCIDENYTPNPNTAYGIAKLMALDLVKGFAEENNIEWFWLRLFPIFGEKEADNWLIPSVIKKLLTEGEMDLTEGLQQYAYIYINDFSNYIFEISRKNANKTISGVYNISGDVPISLRNLVEKIKAKVNPNAKLNFGALEYRHYQSMLMMGDMSKYFNNISKPNYSNFDESLEKTINYYLNKLKNDF